MAERVQPVVTAEDRVSAVLEALQADLRRFAEENVIGVSSDSSLAAIEDGIAEQMRARGMIGIHVSAKFVWECGHQSEDEDGEWVSDCDFSVSLQPPWLRQPIRRLWLKLRGHPGFCPRHGIRLHNAARVKTSGYLPSPMVFSTIKIG